MEPFLIMFGIIAIAIVIRLVAGAMDGDRIDAYIRHRGGKIVEKHWNPFGKGWFGEKDSRIYELTYRDAEGNLHKATCKTSMLSGVYFTEDKIIKKTPPRQETSRKEEDNSALQEENRRLREELARLKNDRNFTHL